MINRVRRVIQKEAPKPETLKIMRSREYRGSRIVRLENGDQYVILEKGGYVKTEGLEHGMKIIDKSLEVEQQHRTSRRPLRTSHNTIKEPEGPFGPWMKNPPSTCRYKKQDKEGLWVECVACGFSCSEKFNCPVYAKMMEGRKDRIKHSGT